MEFTITPTASVVAGADGFAYGPAVPVDFGALNNESPPSPDPGTAGTGTIWAVYPTGTTPAQAAAGSVAPLDFRGTLADDPYYTTSEFPDTYANHEGVLIVRSNQVGNVDPNLPYPAPLTHPNTSAFSLPLTLPPRQYSITKDVDEFLRYRIDYHGELNWEGGVLPPLFTTSPLFRSDGWNTGFISFILTLAPPNYSDEFGQQSTHDSLVATAQGMWTYDGGSWSDGSSSGDQDLGPGQYHLSIYYANDRRDDPPLVDIELLRGFAYHDLFAGVEWQKVPGSDVGTPPLLETSEAVISAYSYPSQRIHFIGGRTEGSRNHYYASAHSLYDNVLEITPADVGSDVVVPANTAIVVSGPVENDEVDIVFSDNSFYDYGAIGAWVESATTFSVTMEGDTLTATTVDAAGGSLQLNSQSAWPFIERFDPATSAWLAPIPIPRIAESEDNSRAYGTMAMSASYDLGGATGPVIYFSFGAGNENGAATGFEFFMLNPATGVITRKADLPFYGHVMMTVPGGKIHLVSDVHSDADGQVAIYTPETDTWAAPVPVTYDLSRAPDIGSSFDVYYRPSGYYGLGRYNPARDMPKPVMVSQSAIMLYDQDDHTATVLAKVPVQFAYLPVIFAEENANGRIHFYGQTQQNNGYDLVMTDAVYDIDYDAWQVIRTEWLGTPVDPAWEIGPTVTQANDGYWWPKNTPGLYHYPAFPGPEPRVLPDYRHLDNKSDTPGNTMWTDVFMVNWVGGDMSGILAAQNIADVVAEYPVGTGPLGYFDFQVRPGRVWDIDFTHGDAWPTSIGSLNGITDPAPAWESGAELILTEPQPAGPYMLTVTHSREVGSVQEDVDAAGMYTPTLIPGMVFADDGPPPGDPTEYNLVVFGPDRHPAPTVEVGTAPQTVAGLGSYHMTFVGDEENGIPGPDPYRWLVFHPTEDGQILIHTQTFAGDPDQPDTTLYQTAAITPDPVSEEVIQLEDDFYGGFPVDGVESPEGWGSIEGGPWSRLSIDAVAGQTYYVAVAFFEQSLGGDITAYVTKSPALGAGGGGATGLSVIGGTLSVIGGILGVIGAASGGEEPSAPAPFADIYEDGQRWLSWAVHFDGQEFAPSLPDIDPELPVDTHYMDYVLQPEGAQGEDGYGSQETFAYVWQWNVANPGVDNSQKWTTDPPGSYTVAEGNYSMMAYMPGAEADIMAWEPFVPTLPPGMTYVGGA